MANQSPVGIVAMEYKLDADFLPRRYTKLVNAASLQKNLEKLCDQFSIPSNETILYVLGPVSFTGLYAIITDYAIYTKMINRLPFSELCGCLIFQTGPKAAVKVADTDNERILLSGTLIAKNTVGTELVQFVEQLQTFLLERYSWAREQRNRLAQVILAVAKAEMRTGTISEDRRFLLDLLSKEPFYRENATLLIAESICRLCDEEAYRSFAKEHLFTEDQITTNRTKYLNSLIDDLSDGRLHFSEAELNNIYHNLSKRSDLPEQYILILPYVCIRLNKDDQFASILALIEQRHNKKQIKQLKHFRACFGNARMEAIYQLIQDGVMPSSEQLNWTDSMGLTPLHYAIILHQDKLVKKLLESRTWKEASPVSTNDEAANVYEYAVAASYVEGPNRALICQKTSPMIQSQFKSKKALERKLLMKRAKLGIQNKAYDSAREAIKAARRNHMPEKEQQLKEQLEELRYRRELTQDEIREAEQALADIISEIDHMTQDAMIESLESVKLKPA